MEWITKYSIGAALIAAALTLPTEANAQTRSSLMTHGVGSTNAQRVGSATTSQTGVYVAPSAGVGEVAIPTDAYEHSSWAPSTTEGMTESAAAPNLEELQRRYDENQSLLKARNEQRAAREPRQINAPMTLGMLKDKPAAQRGYQQSAVQPRYLKVAPSAQTSQSNYLQPQTGATAASAVAGLNWDGSTNRGDRQFGGVQSPTPGANQPVLYNADVTAQTQNAAWTQAAYNAQAPNGVAPFPAVSDEPANAPAIVDAPAAPSLPEAAQAIEEESSDFAADVMNELDLSGATESLSAPEEAPAEAPALETPEAAAPNAPTFSAPDFASEPLDTPAEDPAELDVPDFNAPRSLEPVPDMSNAVLDESEDAAPVAEEPAEVPAVPVEEPAPAPAPVEAAPAPTQAPAAPQEPAQNAQAPATPAAPQTQAAPVAPAQVPAAQSVYPMPKNVTPYAPQPVYQSVAPYMGQPGYGARPRAAAIPQSRGIPSQFRYNGGPMTYQNGVAQQSYEAVDGYGSGMDLASYAATGARPGLIVGAEWLYWTTDADVSYATVRNSNASVVSGRDLEVKDSGLRGRFGFRSVAGWDLIGTYTWFNQGADGALTTDQLGAGESSFSNDRYAADLDLNSVESKIKTDLQMIDIETGRWTKAGLWDFRFFGGVRWTGLNQEVTDAVGYGTAASTAGDDLLGGEIAVLDSSALADEDIEADAAMVSVSDASSTPIVTTGTTGLVSDAVGTRSRLNAYGVRLGLEARVPLFAGLGVYGKGAGALSAGRVKSTLYNADWEAQSEFKKTYLTPSVDAGLGLSWRVNELEARAGYEFNGWYNSGYVSGKKTDFLTHGVVAGLGYNY